MYDYLIVGSGLYGATFAYMAHQKGKKCLVIDRRNQAGSNVACRRMEGIDVHLYGPHIFHTSDEQVWRLVTSLVTMNRFTLCTIANYQGCLYNLPFNMYTFHQMWGAVTPDEARNKVKEQRGRYAGITPRNLEEQALQMVGSDIYSGNGENDNQGGDNQNGNQGGENVGGGNGESGENGNIGDGYNEPANTSVTGGWCFYNCIAYAYNYINFLAGVKPIKAKDVLNAYVTYLNNTNSGSGGLSQEELSYEIFYGPKFYINNDINSDIISFINQYFTTNSEGWATSSEEIQLCINSTVVSTLCLGILGTTERGHAVFVQSFSDNEYTCFDPSVDLTYTVPSYMLKCVLRLSIRLSMPVF